MGATSVLIVGGGVAGLSTAWHLARRGGHAVRVLEREPALGTQSSGKNAAILRSACGDALERELARRGVAFLQAPPAGFVEAPLVRRVGLVLTAGAEGAAELAGWIEATPPEITVLELGSERLARLAPHWRGAGARAWLFPEEGRLDTVGLVSAFAAGARRAGAVIETATAVRALATRGGRVRGVRLADGRLLEADLVVLAAGGWAGGLGRAAGSRLRLRPTRRHLLVTAADPGVREDWPVVWGLDERFYVRPEGRGLLLCACDEVEVDPDEGSDPAVEGLIRAAAGRVVPDQARLPTARFWHGLRTFTADGRFAVGHDPDVEGLFWVAGLGGAGMVTSPEVGRLAAALVAGEAARDPLAASLDPARFARGPSPERAR